MIGGFATIQVSLRSSAPRGWISEEWTAGHRLAKLKSAKRKSAVASTHQLGICTHELRRQNISVQVIKCSRSGQGVQFLISTSHHFQQCLAQGFSLQTAAADFVHTACQFGIMKYIM